MLLRKSLVAGLLFAVPAFAGVAQKYDVIDLGTFCNASQPTAPCGTYSYASSINDQGVVVGSAQGPLMTNTDGSQTRVFNSHSFAWSDAFSPNKLLDLGDLGRDNSFAVGINSTGLITGYAGKLISTSATGVENVVARSYKVLVGGVIETLPTPTTPTENMRAQAIADNDTIVGAVTTQSISGDDNFYTHGFVLQSGATTPTLITGLDNKRETQLTSVNSTVNLAVGYSSTSTGISAIAVRLNDLASVTTLTGLGGVQSQANAVNSSGKIAGRSLTSDNRKFNAVVFDINGSTIDLGQFNTTFAQSNALGINDAGLVVGTAQRESGTGRMSAFVYDLNASMPTLIDLNAKIDCASDSFQRWDLVSASDVNNNGEIIGFGTFGGQVRAFLLRPSADQVNAPIQCAPLKPEFEDKNSAGASSLWALLMLPLLLVRRRVGK